MAAMVLAGGSVAGCAGAGDPGDGGIYLPPTLASADGQQALLVVGPAPTIQVDRVPVNDPSARKPQYRVPLCNANPDPCCRHPDSEGCEGSTPRVTVTLESYPK